jgi:hypothetical protein
VFVPFGVYRTARQQGMRFVLVLVACLGFVSLSWVMRSMLGLDRHFVVAVPLYATFAAQGLAVVADWGARSALRVTTDVRAATRAGRGLAATLAVCSLAGLGVELSVWMGFWRDSIARGWPDRVALGTYLRSLPSSSALFCDDATLEILSGIDRRRFDRHWMDDPHTWNLVHEVARAQGTAYVATWRRKLAGHEGDGEIAFVAGADPEHRENTGLAVMRVTADAGRSPR